LGTFRRAVKTFGLTGGVGMGKSTVGRLFQERGIPVVDTDVIARQMVEPGQAALADITAAFGHDLLDASGHLRRDQLATIVFSNQASREKLESILHPRIRRVWKRQIESWRLEGRPNAVVVIPLLFETSAEKDLDETICVACSAVTQRRRLESRGWPEEQIARRVAAQWPVEKKMAASDRVIWSEGDLDLLGPQIDRILDVNSPVRA
jgi:dephospho-CoA kinase